MQYIILYSVQCTMYTIPNIRQVIELDECGELDRLLSYCALKYRNLHTIEEARKADELLKMQTSG